MPGHLDGGVRATNTVEDHHLVGQFTQACRQTDFGASETLRDSVPVPPLEHLVNPREDTRIKVESFREPGCYLTVRLEDQRVSGVPRAQHPRQVLGSIPACASCRRGEQPCHVAPVAEVGLFARRSRLQLISAKEKRLLMRGRGAPEVPKQAGVVDIASFAVACAHSARQFSGDQTRPNRLFRRLPGPQIRHDGQGSQHIGQAKAQLTHRRRRLSALRTHG